MSEQALDAEAILDQAAEAVNADNEESTSASEELAAPEEETQAADANETEEQQEEADEQAAVGRSEKFRKLLEKYGGDEDKLAEGVFEQQNSLSRMNAEIRELKELILQAREEPEDEAESLSSYPEIQDLVQELKALDAESQSGETRRNQILQTSAALNFEIAGKKGEMKHADDYQKQVLQQEINFAESRQAELRREWNDLDRRDKEIVRDKRNVERQRKAIEKELKAEKVQEKNQNEAQKAKSREHLNTFFGAFQQAASQYVVPEDDIEYMANAVRRNVREYLESLGNAPEQDIPALTRAATAEFARRARYARRGAAPKAKAEKPENIFQKPSAKPVVPGSPKASKDKLPEGWNKMSDAAKAQFGRDRARAILG